MSYCVRLCVRYLPTVEESEILMLLESGQLGLLGGCGGGAEDEEELLASLDSDMVVGWWISLGL
jgi:hypothetical protein